MSLHFYFIYFILVILFYSVYNNLVAMKEAKLKLTENQISLDSIKRQHQFRLLEQSAIHCAVYKQQAFLVILEAGSLRSECRPGQILVRAPFQVCRWCLLPVFSHSGEQSTLVHVAPYKGTNLIPKGSTPLT